MRNIKYKIDNHKKIFKIWKIDLYKLARARIVIYWCLSISYTRAL